MTLDDILAADPSELDDPIALMRDSAYSWGHLAAIAYDPRRTDIFPGPSYLLRLWERCQDSGRAKDGILPELFCGVRDISAESVVALLRRSQVAVVGEWRERRKVRDPLYLESYFHPFGFCFPSSDPILADQSRQPSNPNSLFAGYGFFADSWGTPQQTILMYLGLSYLFAEYRLAAIHGVRYADNHLTRRFASKFGFRDIGTIPDYLYRIETGALAAATVSTLSRDVFADNLRAVFLKLREETYE